MHTQIRQLTRKKNIGKVKEMQEKRENEYSIRLYSVVYLYHKELDPFAWNFLTALNKQISTFLREAIILNRPKPIQDITFI